MGVTSVAVYSDPDHDSAHVNAADEAFPLGGQSPAESYLRGDLILEIAKKHGVEAIIPGYGFLSENTAFAEECERAGIAFIGPTSAQIRDFGLKHKSRELAKSAGVPLVPGTGLLENVEQALREAEKLGYPVMLKSTAGGGGIGLTRCNDARALNEAFTTVKRLARNFFSDSGVFLERFVDNARHVEVQIFGDGKGKVLALGERDCSLQRRNQKVVEETPAPRLPTATRSALLEAAGKLGESVNYRSAGTVEFIYDPAHDQFYFLEVNTRLQVEHPITESVTGVDLVEWMVRTAAGEAPDLSRELPIHGASIEVRLYAEDPARDFQPSPGTLTEVFFPKDARVDTWVATGTEVSPHYDPMLAKIIVWGKDRTEALARLHHVLSATRVAGISTNLDYLRAIIASDFFREGNVATNRLANFSFTPSAVEVLVPGTYTSVQDYPGRLGYWDIGTPPSGPMDAYAFRLANRIVGNHESAAALECTLVGPHLRFYCDTLIALTGAPSKATLDGIPVTFWKPIPVRKGQILRVGRAEKGCRSYLAIRAGLDVPLYLGSRSTFVLGQFGGHAGRILRAGDMLPINKESLAACTTHAPISDPAPASPALVPEYPDRWEIGVLYGPHGAPDFFTPESIENFFATDWEVHYNSNRLGIRLNGPKPSWTRTDGGEAGLHPSNIHDTEYAIGSINFTGDMPVILTQDGPSLGGFVCPVTIAKAELWKVGQVKPGDHIRFHRIDFECAHALEKAQDQAIRELSPAEIPAFFCAPDRHDTASPCILKELPPEGSRPRVAYREAGDAYILLEYGENRLDLRYRLRVHALMENLRNAPVKGILELSPGVRSLQIHYESRTILEKDLLRILVAREEELPPMESLRIPSRIVHLPMAFEDSATLEAVSIYRQSVRDKAPWLPRNAEFIRRINGLDSVEDVVNILFSASYMVLGLGDVYLGAPCAVPVDPRHRLVTSKYNPARTYTAEGTVGIGGVYMCIYGMDSPGGYQLVGRTLPVWNKFTTGSSFEKDKPWLLRFFDQVRFDLVSEEELLRQREAFRAGRLSLKIEESVFDLASHEKFLAENAASIAQFQARQKTAFETEVALWQSEEPATPMEPEMAPTDTVIEGEPIYADISGNIWKILAKPGDTINAGDPLLIVEAMKMEFPVPAPRTGKVLSVLCSAGHQVHAGDPLLTLCEET